MSTHSLVPRPEEARHVKRQMSWRWDETIYAMQLGQPAHLLLRASSDDSEARNLHATSVYSSGNHCPLTRAPRRASEIASKPRWHWTWSTSKPSTEPTAAATPARSKSVSEPARGRHPRPQPSDGRPRTGTRQSPGRPADGPSAHPLRRQPRRPHVAHRGRRTAGPHPFGRPPGPLARGHRRPLRARRSPLRPGMAWRFTDPPRPSRLPRRPCHQHARRFPTAHTPTRPPGEHGASKKRCTPAIRRTPAITIVRPTGPAASDHHRPHTRPRPVAALLTVGS